MSNPPTTINPQYSKFVNRPFWIEDYRTHEKAFHWHNHRCCFNHIIGLPQKDGKAKPIFDYELEIFKALREHKDVFIKKARGLGVTEFLLRFMAYLCVVDSTYSGMRFHIVTGPRINLAEELIDRIEGLFVRAGIRPKKTGPIIYINGVTIQAFPSHTVATMRGYTDVKFILLDEADYFPVGQREEARAVAEGYRIKTRPWVVLVSTPYKPGGLFDTIEHEPVSNYHKVFMPYTRGLGKIYDPEEIEKEKQQGYFEREYNLQYGFGVGNFVNDEILRLVERRGIELSPATKPCSDISPYTFRAMGIDIGYGSSSTAFVITELIDGIVRVIHSEQHERSDNLSMVRRAAELIERYNLTDETARVFVDGSSPGFIKSLKYQVGEAGNYEPIVERAKQDKRDDEIHHYMKIVPVNFSTKHKRMLQKLKKWLDNGKVGIDPTMFPDLITDLRIAEVKDDMTLNKIDNKHDLLDALRLSFEWFRE